MDKPNTPRENFLKFDKSRFAFLLLLLLVGCGPDPARPVPIADEERIVVTRIGVFRDDIAYYSRRGVYVILDRKTGKEYIGVSGVGITEVGDHQAGKVRQQHEQ